MKQILLAITLAAVIFNASLVSARADQYGEVQGTTTEQPREEITHGTVNTGAGENLLILAAMIGTGALTLMLIAKLTRRVYFLD